MVKQQIDHDSYQRRVRAMATEALRFTIQDAKEAIRCMPDGYKAEYYADEICYCATELYRRQQKGEQK